MQQAERESLELQRRMAQSAYPLPKRPGTGAKVIGVIAILDRRPTSTAQIVGIGGETATTSSSSIAPDYGSTIRKRGEMCEGLAPHTEVAQSNCEIETTKRLKDTPKNASAASQAEKTLRSSS